MVGAPLGLCFFLFICPRFRCFIGFSVFAQLFLGFGEKTSKKNFSRKMCFFRENYIYDSRKVKKSVFLFSWKGKKVFFLLSREPQICFSWRFRFSFARGKKIRASGAVFFLCFWFFFMRKLFFKRINMGFSFKNLDMRDPMVKTVRGLNTRLRDKTFVINKSSKKTHLETKGTRAVHYFLQPGEVGVTFERSTL